MRTRNRLRTGGVLMVHRLLFNHAGWALRPSGRYAEKKLDWQRLACLPVGAYLAGLACVATQTIRGNFLRCGESPGVLAAYEVEKRRAQRSKMV